MAVVPKVVGQRTQEGVGTYGRKAGDITSAARLTGGFLEGSQAFIDSLKKHNEKRRTTGRNGDALAKKQLSAIKKWAGSTLQVGFSGREHDEVLYRKDS